MTARHHHYISQCYLKGFTKGSGKKSKLTVLDFREKKTYETIPRNVGGIRDFNQISVEGVNPNILEDELSKFEGRAATALRKLGEGAPFEGEIKDLILNLIAIFAVRSPEMREHWRQFHEQVAERVMDIALETRQRWESQVRQMKDRGIAIADDITYEDVKDFHDSKAYKIEVRQDHHIEMELAAIEAVLPCLDRRNWLIVKSNEHSGPFITTDNPVNLTWKEPDNIPPVFRNSPGYGMRDTQVYFPVSKKLALIGEFDGPERVIDAPRALVAALNTKMLILSHNQVFAPSLNFSYRGEEGEVYSGRDLVKLVDR